MMPVKKILEMNAIITPIVDRLNNQCVQHDKILSYYDNIVCLHINFNF